MTFNSYEQSTDDAMPVFMYDFSRQGISWYYNSSEVDLTVDGHTYLAAPVSTGEAVSTGDSQGDSFEILLPSSTAFCMYLDSITTAAEIYILIKKAHLVLAPDTGIIGPPLTLADAQFYQYGSYVGVDRSAINFRKITCNSLSQSLNREGLRLSWSRNCPHMLYHPLGCKVNKATYGVLVAGGAIVNGEDCTATEAGTFPDDYFSGGFVQWESSPGVFETRGIEKHTGTSLKMFGSTHGLEVGANYYIYPGCDRTAATCNTKFGNSLNFGGIEYMPGKSPFDGTPVF